MVQSVMASSSNKDCEDGLDCFLVNLTGFTDAIPQEITSSSRSSQCDLHVLQNSSQQSFVLAEHNYSEFDFNTSSGEVLQKQKVLAHIDGLVSRKFIQRQAKYCDSCINKLSSKDDSLEFTLIRLKQHSGCRVGMQYPSQRLANAPLEAEEVYCKYKLVSFLLDQCTGFSLACPECSISRNVAHLYTNVRRTH